MRVHALLVLLAGCGRIAIDAVPPDAPTDAALAPCANDGDACDDLDICTTTSTCSGGVCVGTGAPSCTVAESQAEFAAAQGAAGWYYGAWEVTPDPDGTYAATDFVEFALYAGDVWRPTTWEADPSPNFTWAYLTDWGGHPGTYPMVRAPVRRWISDVAGPAVVTVALRKADTAAGDGTRTSLVIDGVEVWQRGVAFDDIVGFSEDVPVTLAVGTRVDLLLHANVNDGADTSVIGMTVASP